MTTRSLPAFLRAGGQSAADIQSRDWRTSPLGSPETWPNVIKSTLATWLRSPQPMFMAWGEELNAFFNDAYRPFLGDRAAGALGRPFHELWSDIWPSIEPIVLKALEGSGSTFEDLPLTLVRSGVAEQTWWSFTYMPLIDEQGAVLGMLCTVNEATQKVLARQRAEAERERLLRLLQQMPGFVVVLRGPAHVLEYVNDAYRQVFGPRLSVGLPVRQVFPELVDQGYFELLDRVYGTGVPFVAHAMPIRLAGESEDRYIEFRYEPMRDAGQNVTGIFVGGYEVTERVRTERQLQVWNETLERRIEEGAARLLQAQDALRHSQKLESVGRLTGGLAHDFNNLLFVIGNSAALLKRQGLSEQERNHCIACIQDTVGRGTELTAQLLAFARRQPLKPTDFDVGLEVRHMTRLLSPLVGPFIHIEVLTPAEPVFVRADVSQFEAALMNLATNARDAMEGGGELSLRVEPVQGLPASHGSAERPGAYVAIHVTDTGCGIPADEQERVFEPFFTTKPEGKGTGLGLSQAIGFAQQSGGDLQLRSAPGQGTTFTLYLPAAPAAPMSPPP